MVTYNMAIELTVDLSVVVILILGYPPLAGVGGGFLPRIHE